MDHQQPNLHCTQRHSNKDKLSHKAAVVALTQTLHLYAPPNCCTVAPSAHSQDEACALNFNLVPFFQTSADAGYDKRFTA